jgi:hypothetical protein
VIERGQGREDAIDLVPPPADSDHRGRRIEAGGSDFARAEIAISEQGAQHLCGLLGGGGEDGRANPGIAGRALHDLHERSSGPRVASRPEAERPPKLHTRVRVPGQHGLKDLR